MGQYSRKYQRKKLTRSEKDKIVDALFKWHFFGGDDEPRPYSNVPWADKWYDGFLSERLQCYHGVGPVGHKDLENAHSDYQKSLKEVQHHNDNYFKRIKGVASS